ncbi:MAG: pyridoxamine kinase [Clostridiales bacterium]|nr:pyridoxamine kinase [Candidatus Equinaster intestinalis]
MAQKRIAAIHDISGFGKCSLTVALPICSAAGIETAVIPTVVLSTHTGGFKGYTFRDLTDDIMPIAQHWKKEGITFDAFYTGYLGSLKQVDLVIEAIELLKTEKTIVATDPAMADNGRLYVGFPEDFPAAMLKLCKKADIIIPNITEACLLLGRRYEEGPYTEEYIEELLGALYKETGAKIVLTGVYFNDKKLGAAVFDGHRTDYLMSEKIDALFHGTGDVFASALISAFIRGKNLVSATEIAVKFTVGSMKRTLRDETYRYGVNFEGEIPSLLKYLGEEDE